MFIVAESEYDYWYTSSTGNKNAWVLHPISLPLQTQCLGTGKFYFSKAVSAYELLLPLKKINNPTLNYISSWCGINLPRQYGYL